MPDRIEIVVKIADRAWRDALPRLRTQAPQAVRAALAAAGYEPPGEGAELCVVFSNDADVQILNMTYRGQDKPTNVLSFADPDLKPFPGQPVYLGDIILARETIQREAALQGKTLADHVLHLVVHGVLHLLGYDHIERAQARRMETLEIAILDSLDIADPYR